VNSPFLTSPRVVAMPLHFPPYTPSSSSPTFDPPPPPPKNSLTKELPSPRRLVMPNFVLHPPSGHLPVEIVTFSLIPPLKFSIAFLGLVLHVPFSPWRSDLASVPDPLQDSPCPLALFLPPSALCEKTVTLPLKFFSRPEFCLSRSVLEASLMPSAAPQRSSSFSPRACPQPVRSFDWPGWLPSNVSAGQPKGR